MIGEKRNNHSLWHCMHHDYEVMKPILHETVRPGAHRGCTDNSAVIAETQARLYFILLILSSFQYI